MKISVCKNCGVPLIKSTNPEYAFQCLQCDEDFYSFEAKEAEAMPVINTPQQVVERFEELKESAQGRGISIKLNTDSKEDLVLYYHEDYSNMVLVDKS